MDKIIYFLLVFLFSILEKSFFNSFLIFGVKPDLVLLLIICYGLNSDSMKSALVGFLSGIIKALVDPQLFGMYLLCYTLAGFFAGFLSEKIYPDKIWVPLIFTFFISIVNVLLNAGLLGLFGYTGSLYLYKSQLFITFYNIIFILPVCCLYDYLFSK